MFTFLHAADLHLDAPVAAVTGRHLPAATVEALRDASILAWDALIDTAIAHGVDFVVLAGGPLNRPKLPDIEGRDSFAGVAMHSARWQDGTDLAGKRVAMIGAGASGFQVAPAIAGDVDRLTIFQRTAQWMFPNPGYHDSVGPGVKWAIRHLPFYGRWYRFLLFWPGCDAGLAAVRGEGTGQEPRPARPDFRGRRPAGRGSVHRGQPVRQCVSFPDHHPSECASQPDKRDSQQVAGGIGE